MKHPKIPLAQTVIQLCKAKNIQHVVLSPGSRNAPLTIGFTHDPFFKCYSIVDERCAAFFALGIAQQIKHPVAVVCTSGSALLNYYPAVSEAYYSHVPLVVLSADRPKYLVGIGDGQTINQENVFKNHIQYSANLKQDLNPEKENAFAEDLPIMKSIENKVERFLGLQQGIQQYNETEINKAFNIAITTQGPVHVNIPFDEPLYQMVDALTVTPEVVPVPEPNIVSEDYNAFAEIWNNSKKKLVLVGVLAPNSVEQHFIDVLAEDESVLILTESTSNLHHNNICPSIDKLIGALTEQELQGLQPEILLTFGGLIVSKKIKKFLRTHKPTQHWHVSENGANDTFFVLNKVFKQSINSFFQSFIPLTKALKSDYNPFWKNQMDIRREKHVQYMGLIPFSDFKAFDVLLKSIPNQTQLQVGNSSAIRYTQLFDINPTLDVFCNRGTSGIDGSTSTAIGAAITRDNPTVFITGDLSFFYDSNALWNNYIPKNFRIIIINNEGGGIFRILPGHKNTDNFDYFFETKHNLSAKQLCQMYGLEYTKVTNQHQLENALDHFYDKTEQPKLLEVMTPARDNDSILLDYFKFVK
ncbi:MULTISPECIES: 2-succinyl-5-enolpyruvyl-6-hydroxy-3-cyclohexene-1-carboxylic-acid synthase [unclassified Olleya]|jgi:2-succinyl-5-enolpyruvyl-6-hydroxy-3-cyclohexene-1-carboxylate synthase|uniref:2-succinyl-5-enolpyruvyl-6-hydroxy-3- cyclohexene-1-carboxylic-acid synthase n=1 Tax=unclassified Olleya TaxID=2615019 RepID=UPI00119E8AEE|nr:2-succinyl-5-enolpyruvyl-6-hydroxy-3-cyclohexene-1-carboxylic-acid synthase [Olleya sp. Hel_I_94]TVZ46694.1 2-succinyl-5-enolpyruvyl-6-hydroxy-3-cyclohexene-1-carboxylate synthase [Olleya sp. Hel_I_94]